MAIYIKVKTQSEDYKEIERINTYFTADPSFVKVKKFPMDLLRNPFLYELNLQDLDFRIKEKYAYLR